VEIDGTGCFVQAQGPCNRENAASRFGATFLARWGVGVRAARRLARLAARTPTRTATMTETPAVARSIAAPLDPPLRPGERPLRTLGQLVAALPWVDARSTALWGFLERVLTRCCASAAGGEGRRWLVGEARDGPMVGLVSLTRSGRIEVFLGREPRAGRPLVALGPPRAADSDDDDRLARGAGGDDDRGPAGHGARPA